MRSALPTRRTFVKLALAAQAAGLLGIRSAAAAELRLGPPQSFSFDSLTEHARELAARDYVPPPRPDPEIVARIDYDAHGKLKFRPEFALWGDGSSAFPITFKTVGKFFPKTVRMHAVEAGQAREILYDPAYFTVAPDSPAAKLANEPSAFAGFWVMEPPSKGDWQKFEPWTTFLGASYFRAIGELGQVGLSARGIALSPGGGGPEEFPDFVGFWFEKAAPGSDLQIVYALLDSPSIAGAYRFLLKRTGGTVMDIDARLFMRRSVDRLGIAPLTAMYWFSETAKGTLVDWRPEVHDSDGLGLYTGAGERIWRPLNNPRRIVVSSFFDTDPRGFGLLQRDRAFNNYLDGVRYEDRPSLWVEPLGGGWGRGAVQLVEIPTDDEIHDNIVAMWVPEKPPAAGDALAYSYRLYWLDDEPGERHLGRVVATRIGRGGTARRPRPGGRNFVVDFQGPALDGIPAGAPVEAVISTTGGEIVDTQVEPAPTSAPGVWRVRFDLVATQGGTPVELRCFLRRGGETLTETWLYQYDPIVAS